MCIGMLNHRLKIKQPPLIKPVEIQPCECGGKGFIDWWQNFRKNFQEETFIRCDSCGKVGKSSWNEQEAIRLWNEIEHLPKI